jgi:hypothetical protein
MNIEAFTQLERILENIEDNSLPFTLSNWCETSEKKIGPWYRRKTEICKTAFCLMGWAAQDPWFIERGFRLSNQNTDEPVVFYDDEIEWDAVVKFLAVTEDEALFLLDGANYGRESTPSEVMTRLRAFVNSKISHQSKQSRVTTAGRDDSGG